MKAIEVEEAVARMFNIRRHIIVPNVSWGFWIHECDLLIIRPSGFAIEIEIKVSKADLKKDAAKRHGHEDHLNRIKELYFAVPEKLLDAALEFAPADAGIISVEPWDQYWPTNPRQATIKRPATIRKNARPLKQDEIAKVARLGCMRIWPLKAKLIKQMAKAA